MTDCPAREQLRLLLDGELADAAEREVSAHVEGCARCQQVLEEMTAVTAARAPTPPGGARVSDGDLQRLRGLLPPARGSSAEVPALTVWPAVPGYEVLRELGRGGMAVVYEARELRLNRLVALKMIRAGAQATPEQLVRFCAEGEIVARLRHPNIVQIYEVGTEKGRPYLALEVVEGGSLSAALKATPLPPPDAARLVAALAGATDYAHGRGVVHRDLNPANVLLHRKSEIRNSKSEGNPKPQSQNPKPSRSDLGFSSSDLGFVSDFEFRISDFEPKITDFGLAKLLGQDSRLTQTGLVMGTPSYMAPEQVRGQNDRVGPQADVYALGAILYECLTGRPPFLGAAPLETMRQVAELDPVPPSRLLPQVPRDLEVICLKCLEKEPARRYAGARELADDLGRFLKGEPIAARPVGTLERSWKWARRRPAVSGLLAGLVLITALGVAGVSAALVYAVRGWDRAEEARNAATASAASATAGWKTAEENGERLKAQLDVTTRGRMTATMLRAAALIEGHPDQARALLESEADCPPELRDFAWGYYYRQVRPAPIDLRVGGEPRTVAALAPGGRTLATGGAAGGVVRLWDGSSGQPAGDLEGLARPVEAIAWSPDGVLLAAAAAGADGKAGEVKVWDASGHKVAATLPAPAAFVRLAFSANGRRLAVSGGGPTGGEVVIWDTSGWETVSTVRQPGRPFTALALSPDGAAVAVGLGADRVPNPGQVAIYLSATGARTASLACRSGVRSLAFSPDGRSLVAGGCDREAWLWSVLPPARPFNLLATLGLPGDPAFVTSVAFSPDGTTLATACGRVVLWDALSGNRRGTVPDVSQATGAAFTADGLGLVVTEPGRVRLCSASGGEAAQRLRGHFGRVRTVAFVADGRTVMSAGDGDGVRLWDRKTGRPGASFGRRTMTGAAITADGRTLAFGDEDGSVMLYDVATKRPIAQMKEHTMPVCWLAFSPDGRSLATSAGGPNRGEPVEVKLWDVATASLRATLGGHTRSATGLAFTADGRRLVTASPDGTWRLWDAATGEPVGGRAGEPPAAQPPERDDVPAAALAADAATLVTADPREGRVDLYDVGTGRLLRSIATDAQAVAATGSGRMLTIATADAAGRIHLWEGVTGQERALLPGHAAKVLSLAFSADGLTLASGSDSVDPQGRNCEVKLWEAVPPPRAK
jgi:serine/threonine protein kinase/WD40 repeat protein